MDFAHGVVRYIALDHLTWNDPNEIWL